MIRLGDFWMTNSLFYIVYLSRFPTTHRIKSDCLDWPSDLLSHCNMVSCYPQVVVLQTNLSKLLILSTFWKSPLSSPLCSSRPLFRALLCETFLDLLSHTLSSCFWHIQSVLVIWYFLRCLMASLGFNFGHTSNLPLQLDCHLLVSRGHTFYFVICSFATGQSMLSIHMKLAASEQDLSLSILVATQSQLRPIVHMNGESLVDNNAENISRCLW